jgi:hypothetical protein
MYKIIDDIVSKDYQRELAEAVKNTSWNYTDSVTFSSNDKNSGFYRMVYGLSNDPEEDPIMDPHLYNLLLPLLNQSFEKFDVVVEQIYRMKLGLFVKHQADSFDVLHHEPHVDGYEPHLTMLYYFMNSDGPTYIFDDYKRIIDKVDPKMGRCVLMSGDTYHASSPPRKFNRRIVLNVNFGDKY